MKAIFKSLMIISAGILALASCVKENAAPLATTVGADKAKVELEAVQGTATLNITADGDWILAKGSLDSWYSITPASGSGNATVTIKAEDNVNEYNEVIGPRSGVLTIIGAEATYVVTVSQKGEAGLDTSRQYAKITSTDDIEAGKGYLIVTKKDDKYYAAKPFSASKESYYSYVQVDEVSETDGLIVRPNDANGFTLVTKDAGYALRMSNGRYLFQAASYNNFYSTEDIAKADVWTVAFNEDGTVKLVNTTISNKYFQYTSYGNYGAYSDAQDGGILPSLYKDSAAQSDETLSAENVSVSSDATGATITVSSNKTWQVRNHDSWIKTFTKTGTGNGTVEITFDGANNTGETRTATFIVLGETKSVEVTVTQAAPMTTIAEVSAWAKSGATSYAVTLTDAVVSYVNGNNAYIEDATGGILVYSSGHGLVAGNKINGKVTGGATVYNALPQMASIDVTEAEVTTDGTIPCTELTIAKLLADFDRYVSCRVKLTDVEVTDALAIGDRNGEVSAGEEALDIYAKVKDQIVITAGSKGDLICFPGYNNSDKQGNVWASEDLDASVVGTAITVDATASVEVGKTVDLEAEANVTATITYTSDAPAVATVDAAGVVTGVAEGTANIKVAVAAGEGYTAAEKTVVVTVTAATAGGEEEDTTITIAEALAAAKGENVTIDGQVTATCKKGIVVTDETESIFVYTNSDETSNYAVGDNVVVEGKSDIYNFAGQIASPKVTKGESGTYTYPTPVVMDGAACDALVATLDGKDRVTDRLVDIKYVSIEGTVVAGNYINLNLEGATKAQGSIYNAPASFGFAEKDGQKVTVVGYLQSVSSGKFVNIIVTEVK